MDVSSMKDYQDFTVAPDVIWLYSDEAQQYDTPDLEGAVKYSKGNGSIEHETIQKISKMFQAGEYDYDMVDDIFQEILSHYYDLK